MSDIKKKGLILFISQVCTKINSFIFFSMIHEATRYTRYQSYRQHKGDTMEMKSKLYLRFILLIDYMMEENLFLNVEQFPVNHATSRFSVRKDVTEKKKKKTERE